jgi:hypothetical protein
MDFYEGGESMNKELVNHPDHYNMNGRKECIVEMEERYGAKAVAFFCLLNAYKYLYRAGNKDGNTEEQDVQKARWYYNYLDVLNSHGVDFKSSYESFHTLQNDIKETLSEYEESEE